MSVEVVTYQYQDYVLLPHRADWSMEPELERRWQTKVTTGLTGSQDRAQVRPIPFYRLRWMVTAANERENSRIEARVIAALKSGRACAPWFGRGMKITTATAMDPTITVESSPWEPVAGDLLIMFGSITESQPVYEVVEVVSVESHVILLGTTLGYTWPTGSLCYPLILGAFTCDQRPMIQGANSVWTFAIESERPDTIPDNDAPETEPTDDTQFDGLLLVPIPMETLSDDVEFSGLQLVAIPQEPL